MNLRSTSSLSSLSVFVLLLLFSYPFPTSAHAASISDHVFRTEISITYYYQDPMPPSYDFDASLLTDDTVSAASVKTPEQDVYDLEIEDMDEDGVTWSYAFESSDPDDLGCSDQ